MNGILIIDKPEGFTSHDVVARLRRILGTKKIGHTGTLDPFATGVLVMLVGKATRLARFLDKDEKTYEAVLAFGFETDTGDRTGKPRGSQFVNRSTAGETRIEKKELLSVLSGFTGDIEQIPPMYSAKKIGGEKLYKLARKGIEVTRKPVSVLISELSIVAPEDSIWHRSGSGKRKGRTPEILNNNGSDEETRKSGDEAGDVLPDVGETQEFIIRVSCSAGTYIRTLAEDIGRKLGVGCHLSDLRRTRAGKFDITHSFSLEELADKAAENDPAEILIPMSDGISHLPEICLTNEEVAAVGHGRQIAAGGRNLVFGDTAFRMTDAAGSLIAIGFFDETENTVKPQIVMI